METITPLQHQQTLSLYHTLKTQTQTSNLHLSPQNAFISLFLLNLPAPALYHYTKHHATRAAPRLLALLLERALDRALLPGQNALPARLPRNLPRASRSTTPPNQSWPLASNPRA
ncbi:hypothetical protein Q7P37_004604 [Cladosporium fusiforme]